MKDKPVKRPTKAVPTRPRLQKIASMQRAGRAALPLLPVDEDRLMEFEIPEEFPKFIETIAGIGLGADAAKQVGYSALSFAQMRAIVSHYRPHEREFAARHLTKVSDAIKAIKAVRLEFDEEIHGDLHEALCNGLNSWIEPRLIRDINTLSHGLEALLNQIPPRPKQSPGRRHDEFLRALIDRLAEECKERINYNPPRSRESWFVSAAASLLVDSGLIEDAHRTEEFLGRFGARVFAILQKQK